MILDLLDRLWGIWVGVGCQTLYTTAGVEKAPEATAQFCCADFRIKGSIVIPNVVRNQVGREEGKFKYVGPSDFVPVLHQRTTAT
jgi:hypothetical protein